jgi:hypothetical protein
MTLATVALLLCLSFPGQQQIQSAQPELTQQQMSAVIISQNQIIIEQNKQILEKLKYVTIPNPPKQHNKFVKAMQVILPIVDHSGSIASIVSVFGVTYK